MMLHPDSATKDVKSILISCFAAAESAGPSADRTAEERELAAEDPIDPFHPPQFFEAWFRTHGTPLFFLFNKNLKVTNIQFAELLALIRRYVTSSVDATPIEVQFVSPRDFNATVTHIISTFHRDPQHPDHRWKTLADLYADMISRLICVDAFFGSCAVFLPPGLRLSLIDVCFRAGYIHSCGLNVFTRNVYKARKEVFISRVLTHCRKHFTGGNKVLFRVYCHEDFTPYDRPYEKALQAGLDDVKIHLGKTYMGGAALVEVLEELNEKTGGMLIIPAPGDYHRSARHAEDRSGRDGLCRRVDRDGNPL
ncbi:MAG: hypothetical protein K6T59_15515 [Bryobacteraceae bacterium]|nr:hypothetical protein [Bryobacteraceae bacterium]